MREQRGHEDAGELASAAIAATRDGSGIAEDLAAFVLGPAPLDDGAVYPGAFPRVSYLFTGDAVEPVGGSDGMVDRIEARLHDLGAAPLARRHVVLAYGSNRSPAQLRAKFAGRGIEPTVPVLVAHLAGLSVVHAAGVTRYGAVPATLVADAGAWTEVAVTFLDDDQLSVVDATEPRHDRMQLDLSRYPVALADDGALPGPLAEALGSCRCYWSHRPVLTRSGDPVRLAAIASTGSSLPARTQADVVDDLLAVWAAHGRPFASGRMFSAAVRTDPDLHVWVAVAAEALLTEPVGDLAAVPAAWRSPG